jgi:hypothetical protein
MTLIEILLAPNFSLKHTLLYLTVYYFVIQLNIILFYVRFETVSYQCMFEMLSVDV